MAFATRIDFELQPLSSHKLQVSYPKILKYVDMPHDDPTLTFPPGHEGAHVQNKRNVYIVPNLYRFLLKPAYLVPKSRTRGMSSAS